MLFHLDLNEKYAFISINGRGMESSLPDELQIESDLWICRKFPFVIPDHWKEWMGEFFYDDVMESNLFLVAKCAAVNLESLDAINKKLTDKVYSLYWGILFADAFRCKGTPYQITGERSENGISIRQIVPLPEIFFTNGIHVCELTHDSAINAQRLAAVFPELSNQSRYLRFFRVLNSFYRALQSNEVHDRLHQFVRCIEGFMLPEIGATRRQFVSRSSLFISPFNSDLIGEIYDIRCDVEHMHSPIKSIRAANKGEILENRTIISEHIARYCVQRFLLNRALWVHFEEDERIRSFWSLPADDQRSIWGSPFDLSQLVVL